MYYAAGAGEGIASGMVCEAKCMCKAETEGQDMVGTGQEVPEAATDMPTCGSATDP